MASEVMFRIGDKGDKDCCECLSDRRQADWILRNAVAMSVVVWIESHSIRSVDKGHRRTSTTSAHTERGAHTVSFVRCSSLLYEREIRSAMEDGTGS